MFSYALNALIIEIHFLKYLLLSFKKDPTHFVNRVVVTFFKFKEVLLFVFPIGSILNMNVIEVICSNKCVVRNNIESGTDLIVACL